MSSVKRDAKRGFLLGIVVSLVLTAAIAIATLLAGDFGETEGRILLTTASISFFSLLSLPAGVLLDQRRLRGLAFVELVATVLGFLLALNLIWVAWEDAGDGDWKSFAIVTTAAGALAQAAGVESRRRENDPPWTTRLALASHVSVATLAALIAAAVAAEIDEGGYYRALGAVAVSNVLLVTLQPVLRRMSARPEAVHAFVCVVAGGRRVEYGRTARDFATAVAYAIRELEGAGERVVAIERAGKGPDSPAPSP